MKQSFQKSNKELVLEYFLERPYSEIYLRALAYKLRVTPSTVFRVVNELIRQGFLEKRAERHACFLKARLTPAFKAHKIAHALTTIQHSGILDLVRARTRGLYAFLLFGSAARGEDDEQSDYDFLLIAASSDLTAHELAEQLGREVNLKSFTIAEWQKVSKQNKPFYQDVLLYSWPLIGDKPVLD